MRIKLINPNTTVSMTEAMTACARAVAAAGTEITGVSPQMGPASIESHYDEALAVPGLLQEIERGERDGYDAYVIACFGDPGLSAARELARGPVIGIAEAAMHMASLIAPGFSVVTTLARTSGMAWHLAERYGMQRFCRNVRACEIAVLELEIRPPTRAPASPTNAAGRWPKTVPKPSCWAVPAWPTCARRSDAISARRSSMVSRPP